jgi:RHS repeat-associated protein
MGTPGRPSGDATSSDVVPQHYKFTGKERDSESNLDMFGARYYRSSLGRFMTPDWAEKPTNVPYANFGNPQSLNLYSCVKNNPLTLTDPDGHCWAWAEKLCDFWNYGVWVTNVQLQTMISDSQILEHEILARAERVDDPSDEVAKRGEHGRNLIRRPALQPNRQSLILESHDILMRDNPGLRSIASISMDSLPFSSAKQL